MKKKNIDKTINKEENMSFFEKMKTDKKYNAKVQLIGYGVLVVALIIYVNITSLGSVSSGNSIMNDNDNSDYLIGADDEDSLSLLEKLEDNYNYDVVVNIKTEIQDDQLEEESKIHYVGKSYGNQLEITKEDSVGSNLYYKVDNKYYSKNDEGMEFIEEDIVYDVVDSDYIELNSIMDLLDKASLDHVTDYSSGKKEYVYHLKVRDIIVSYKLEDVVEFKIEEENGILKINVDYSILLRVINSNILECKLEAIVTDIGKVEKFLVLDNEDSIVTE